MLHVRVLIRVMEALVVLPIWIHQATLSQSVQHAVRRENLPNVIHGDARVLKIGNTLRTSHTILKCVNFTIN